MGEGEPPGAKTVIKHRGFFDFQKVIKAIQGFFTSNDFSDIVWEQYKVRASEYEIILKGHKKVTEYVKFTIEVHIWIYDFRKVEIVKEGQKLQTNDGKFLCELTPELILDWEGAFTAAGPFRKVGMVLKDLLRKYILKYKIDDYWWDLLYIKTGELGKIIQDELGQEVV